MSEQESNSYDLFAAAALQALISKSVLFDTDGELGRQTTAEYLDNIMREMARSAHCYACHMIRERKQYTNWLEGEMNKSA